MNVIHTEDPTRPPACDPLDEGIRQQISENFDDVVFRDVDDIWGQKTNSRQFMTNPSTTHPNDQKAFAEWLYGDMRRTRGKTTRPPAPPMDDGGL